MPRRFNFSNAKVGIQRSYDVDLNGVGGHQATDALQADHVPVAFSIGYGASAISAGSHDQLVLKKHCHFVGLTRVVSQRFPVAA